METISMQLIVNSGDAKSQAMEAIQSAKNGKIAEARAQIDKAGEYLTEAHRFQTEIIQEEADGNIKNMSVLLAHAQDHLMSAIMIIDIAKEFIDLYEKFFKNKEEGK
nr:PTS lactose/cellobiose transporter subunit IIA [Caproiciproducens galactitolivorans]